MQHLASEEHCPVILRPEAMKRRFGFDAEAKYGRNYKPMRTGRVSMSTPPTGHGCCPSIETTPWYMR
jgi:hypothetical protein